MGGEERDRRGREGEKRGVAAWTFFQKY